MSSAEAGSSLEPPSGGGRGLIPSSEDRQSGVFDTFTESIGVMKALWTQERAEFKGDLWQLDGVPMSPKPVQKPHPPLWFGGRHPSGLRRAVRLADGFMGAGSTSTAQFRDHVSTIREELEHRQRDPAEFPISKRVYIAVDDDADRAKRRLTEWFGSWYGRAEMAAEVSVWGSIEACAEGLQEVVDAGAEMLMLNPVFDYDEHLETLMSEVGPALELSDYLKTLVSVQYFG